MKEKTEKKHRVLRSMYEQGSSLAEIAEATGYKESSVATLLNKTGAGRRKRRMEDYMPKMLQMRREGKTLEEISRETGFTISGICTKLNRHGCRKNIMHNIYGETEMPDGTGLTYAASRKKMEKITVNGREYVDVTGLYC